MKLKLLLSAFMLMPLSLSAQEADWAMTQAYYEANKNIAVRPKAVLLGDSIHQFWHDQHPEFFTENNLAGRGIAGQTTTQILCRMREDVVNLRPEYVVILAGINDIALNEGHAANVRVAAGHIKSMCEIAKANGIRPLICAMLPAHAANWRPEVTDVAEKVVELNSMLKEYAEANNIGYVDYYTLFADENNRMPVVYSEDSIHPTMEGYRLMEEYLLEFIK